jgi:hypothetical protein
MMRVVVPIMAMLVSACSSTPADLEQKAEPVTRSFAESYQEIYRRVSGPARRCFAGNVGAYASFAVDSDLYSDLGHGEITLSLINWGTRNYYMSTKIERADSGSTLTVRAGNTLAAGNAIENVLRWAGGDSAC